MAALIPNPSPEESVSAESPIVNSEVRLAIIPSEQPVSLDDSESLMVEAEVLKQTEFDVVVDKEKVSQKNELVNKVVATTLKPQSIRVSDSKVFTVPFYSQFSDISTPSWQKVGCGITSLAMLISYYEKKPISVDSLLEKGISAGAYLDSAGWIHSGLINLSHAYGLDGESLSFANLSMDDAFAKLEKELKAGPVMASVHYTFEPTNPIPHLVVVNGVRDGKVFYNDPAESVGGESLSIEKFERGWKKRYITIRPVS
ncbi:MAG: hypothetical protein RLZZ230_623 [Candidatus Parcubacteria bacterium]